MKNLIFVVVTLFIFSSCLKDTNLFNPSDGILNQRSNIKVEICHNKGHGDFIYRTVNAGSVPGHLAHGDAYPGECYDSGFYLNAACQLIDVSLEVEICGNNIDDNCDGFTDEGDVTTCGCPCFSMDDIMETKNLEFYDYRLLECAGPFVGFTQDGSCNYGVNAVGSLALGPDCEVCFDLTEVESNACLNLLEQAQRILSLPKYCQEFTTNSTNQKFIEIQNIK